MRYRRMKLSCTLNQRRAAVGALIRESFLSSSMRAIRKAGSDIDDNIERYFSDPEYQGLVAKALEDSGYTADAIEAEVFARSLQGLLQIEKLITSAEKRLMFFFREWRRFTATVPFVRRRSPRLRSLRNRSSSTWRRINKSRPTNATRPKARGRAHQKAKRARE
jgi:hypothetical protein